MKQVLRLNQRKERIGVNQKRSAIFFTKVMHDLNVRLFGKAAIRETGLLP